MTLLEFEEMLDRHGPDLALWPAAARTAGERLVSSSPEAATLLDAERQVQQILADGLPTVKASRHLRAAVLEIPLAHPRRAPEQNGLMRWFGPLLRPLSAGAATACAAGVLGFVLGYGQLVNLPGLTGGEMTSEETEMIASLGVSVAPLENLP